METFGTLDRKNLMLCVGSKDRCECVLGLIWHISVCICILASTSVKNAILCVIFFSYHNLPICRAHLQCKFAASHRVLFTSHIHVWHFLQFISHHPGCINFQCFFFYTLSPHLILKSGGQNNGGTKEKGNKGAEKERTYLLAFFYSKIRLGWPSRDR